MRRVFGMATTLAAVVAAQHTFAQSITSVPDGAAVVVKIRNLQDASSKLGTMFTKWGLAEMNPMLGDPLATLEGVANLQQGLKRDGEAAFVFFNPAGRMPDGAPYVILLPVSDYEAFIRNFDDAETEGEITSITMPMDQEPAFMAKWANHAAISPSRSLVATRPRSTRVSGASGDQFNNRDMVAYVNFGSFRNQAGAGIGFGRMMAGQQIDQQAQQDPSRAKYAPLAKAALNQLFNGIEHFLNETQAITIGADVAGDGIQMTWLTDFQADTYLGDYVKQWETPDQSLTAGLPAGNHAIVGGTALDSKTMVSLWDDMAGPVVVEAKRLGPEAQPVLDYIESARDFWMAAPVQSFTFGPGQGKPGESPLFEMVMVLHGDASKAASAWTKMATSQDQFMKTIQPGVEQPVTVGVRENARTIAGVSLHEMTQKITAPDSDPQAQALRSMYGPNGLSFLMGSVNEKTAIATSYEDEARVAAVIAAAREGKDPVGENPMTRQAQGKLPKRPISAIYAYGDQLMALASRASMAFAGTPLEMKLNTTQPFAISLSTEGTAVRMDMYMPSELVQALVETSMREGMKQGDDDL